MLSKAKLTATVKKVPRAALAGMLLVPLLALLAYWIMSTPEAAPVEVVLPKKLCLFKLCLP